MPDNDSATIGYRWVCTRGKDGCEQCSALDGQEFYKNPHGTLRSTAEMPEPPLHPHCRCKLMPIIDPEFYFGDAVVYERKRRYELPRARAILSEADADEGIVMPGLGVCGTGGRSLLDGPTYGYFGGSNWMLGQNVAEQTPEDIDKLSEMYKSVEPSDLMDSLFQDHD